MKTVRYLLVATVTLLIPFMLAGQVLLMESPVSYYLYEYRAISRGVADPYLSLRLHHVWRPKSLEERNDLLPSNLGDNWFRKERLKIYPSIVTSLSPKGGHVNTDGMYIDIAPTINVLARYKLPPTGKYGILFWTRLEKHSVIGQNKIKSLSYDFNWQKEIGRRVYQGIDSTWIEYSIGDGGILLTYPKGEITFAKSNPVWGSGYSGQLWLSDKAPSFIFLFFRHRFTKKWSFSFFHGSLNSTFRDSTHLELYPLRRGLPLVRKYIAAHRLDFSPFDNVRIGFGESVIYGGRGMEMAYLLPFLFYWSTQHELGDSDNLQMFLDFEIIKKGLGRLYGSVYLDEWDFVDTFNKKESRNWGALQIGLTYNIPILSNWNSLLRIEATHLTPYVYIHKSKINAFQHDGHYLGFWSGPNSDNIFIAAEGSPREGWWIQLYAQRTRRGEVNDDTVERQYNLEKIPHLFRTYDGDPETRTISGFRGEITLSSSIRVTYDLYYDNWLQKLDPENDERVESKKFDAVFGLFIGL